MAASLPPGLELAVALLAGVSDGVLVVHAGTVVAVNPALCEITGYEAPELVGHPLPFTLFDPPDQADVAAALRAATAGTAREFEVPLHRRDGHRVEVLVTAMQAQGLLAITVKDLSERRAHAAELARVSTRDEQTGLLNRRGVMARLAEEVARARRHGRALSLCVIDLDRFGPFSEEHGHDAGDRALTEIARRLDGVARIGDITGRIGGEEFCWLLPDADGAGSYAAAERLRYAIASTPIEGVHLPVSFGICDLGDAGDTETLIRLADEALHWAKREGGNRTLRWSRAAASELEACFPGEQAARGLRGVLALARALPAPVPHGLAAPRLRAPGTPA